MDTERNYVCATTLLVWAAVLLALSHVPVAVKILTYVALTGLILFHVQRKQLTYEATLTCLALSGLLFLSDPLVLPQTVLLAIGFLVLATLCLFVPVEAVLLILVFALALTYSVTLTFAVAMRTDPAFTGLFLLTMVVFWLVFVRPGRANELYA